MQPSWGTLSLPSYTGRSRGPEAWTALVGLRSGCPAEWTKGGGTYKGNKVEKTVSKWSQGLFECFPPAEYLQDSKKKVISVMYTRSWCTSEHLQSFWSWLEYLPNTFAWHKTRIPDCKQRETIQPSLVLPHRAACTRWGARRCRGFG